MLPFALLPEACIFDILFRHGGFEPLGSVFDDASTVQRAFPNKNKWSEILCACVAISKLRHPADGVYLLIPETPTIANSRHAWCVAKHCRLSKRSIVQAIQFLLPSSAFVVDEWLDRPDLHRFSSADEWERFAHECVANHQFTAEWHADYGAPMGKSIVVMAETELRRLEEVLYQKEQRRMLDIRRPRFRLSFADEQAVIFETQVQVDIHRRVLQETDAIFKSMSAQLLDAHFHEIASLVAALFKQYPALTWNLKRSFHRVAIDVLGLDVWHIEREVLTAAARCPHPLEALRYLEKERQVCPYVAPLPNGDRYARSRHVAEHRDQGGHPMAVSDRDP